MITHGDVLVEEVASQLNAEALLALISHESLATRVLLLQILDVFIHTPSLGVIPKLSRVNGFQLLANQLRQHNVNEEIMDLLFSMTQHIPVFPNVPHRKKPVVAVPTLRRQNDADAHKTAAVRWKLTYFMFIY